MTWEAIHTVTNQAFHDVLPDNEDILVNINVDNIVVVEMPHKDMFLGQGIICFFARKFLR